MTPSWGKETGLEEKGERQMKGWRDDQRGARHKEARPWPVARDGQINQRFLP